MAPGRSSTRTLGGRKIRRAGMSALIVVTAIVTLSTIGRSAFAATYQDWPTFLQNPSRTAATSDPNLSVASASALKLKWSYQTGGGIATSANVVGTTAYVGSWDGNEYALNTGTGALLWKQYLGITSDPACNPASIGVTSSATVSNGVLYIGGGDAYWYALDAGTGSVLWKVYTGDNSQAGAHYNWSSPLVVNGFAYIGVASNCDNPLVQGHLMKVDLNSHQVVGDYDFVPNGQVGGGVWTSPTFDAATNTVFVSTGTLNDYTQKQSQAVVALDAGTLAYKSSWQLPFESAVIDSDWGTTPTLTTDSKGDQLLSLANKNGNLYTFNRNNLAAGPIWQRQIAIGGDCPTCGDGSIASGVFANGVLYFAGGHTVVNGRGSGGSINAVDPGTGHVLWTHQTEQPIFGSPAYVNGMIGETEGSTFEVINASTGSLLYSYPLNSSSYGAVSVARSQFYVGALNGKLYAFGIGATTSSPPDPNCPTSFTCQDIRNPGIAGSEQTTNGILTVTAAGVAIHGTSDQFRFISQPVTGDSQMSTQIVSQSTQNTQPQAGIMVRQSTDPTAPFFAVIAYPNDLTENLPQPDLVIWYRPAFGVNAIELTKWYPANKPVSVMVQRTGNMFNAGISFDGVNYQLIPGTTADLDMPATTLQGIAVNSGASNNTGTASFANISVGGPITTTMTPQPPTDPCPQSWTCQDIGNPNPPGDTTQSGGSFTLDGTGTGIGGSADSFHYVSQSVSGNQALSAQVVTQSGSPPTAQEGLMFRANNSTTAPFYGVFLNPGGSATILSRTYDGVDNRTKVPLTSTTSPAYLEIIRYQDTALNPPVTFFSTLTSNDGTNWAPVLGSSAAIDMGSGSYLAGMAATAAAPRVTPPVVFNNVTISSQSGPPPDICPANFTSADIGTGTVPGDQVFTNSPSPTGTWTFDASGSDIWSVYDNFRFAYENFPDDPTNSHNGDGTISARVLSQTNPGGPWMKSGVMIRAGSNPQAPYYGAFVTPQHGVVVQWRSSQAAQTNQVAGPSSASPVWVLASRYTDVAHNVVYYSAYTSTDGTNFTYVPGSTVPLNLPGQLVAGIASDSYNAAGRATSAFDNLAELAGSQPPPSICPSGWACADVGGALPNGQDSLSNNGTWSEVGGGGDIWGSADAFHSVSQTLTGDGTVTAHVTAQQATDPWAKAGPMLRASVDPGSPYYAVFVTPANGIAVQWRTAQGGGTNQLLAPGSVPAYLMIARYTTPGNSPQTYYTAYTSPDGNSWTPISGSTMPLNLPEPLLAGFAITSHAQGTGSAVTLDSVGIGTNPPQPPGICPGSWQCADIGGATPQGTQNVTGGTWTVQGGGGDIWGTGDAFRFDSQALSSDGSVSAQVSSQTNTDPWAKAGVMMRSSTDPGSPYYAIYQTPGNGVVVQSRNAQGGIAVQNAGISGVAPVYLQVSRSGTTFTAATSADGVTWTPVTTSAASIPNLGGTVLSGLAVTSHNTSQLSTAVFSSVVQTAAPAVTSLSPNSGSTAGGNSVTITGTNFTGATAVNFGTTAATNFVVNSATSITATSPAEPAGTVDVTVTTPGGTSATGSADQFSYVGQNSTPAVTSVSPNSGSTAGGTSATITGTNLTGATAVNFGTTAATNFVVNSATSITATSPAEPAGTVDVTVTTPGGTSATGSADQFRYLAPPPTPAVTSASPNTGSTAGGTGVTITGTNFTGATAVNFGTTAATNFVVNSATSITATSPAEPAGTVDVTVTTPGGTSATNSADQFSYVAPSLPVPWIDTDVGSPAVGGSGSYANGVYTVKGAGTDIWGTNDQFNYANQPANGNGTLIARVTSQTNTSANAKAGIMFKQSTAAGSPYILIAVAPGGGIKVQYNFNGSVGGGTYPAPNTWMKLTRSGNTFTAYVSSDGVNWINVVHKTLTIATSATVGLFVCSHNANLLGTATFDNVTFTPGP